MEYRGLPISANVSILFQELPYLERFAAARSAGFDEVESWWPFADAEPPAERIELILEALASSDLKLTGLNFWAGDMAAGQRGMANRPDRRRELSANIGLVAEIARRTGCRHFNLLYGQLGPGESEDASARAAAWAYQTAVDAVSEFDGVVLLEPLAKGLNGDYPIVTAADALGFIDRHLGGDPRLKLLLDTFHLGHNGEDIVSVAQKNSPRIGHVQIADNPGRGEPGSGHLPIQACIDALVGSKYDGRIAAEYKPAAATADSFGWLDKLSNKNSNMTG